MNKSAKIPVARPAGMHPDAWAAYLKTGIPISRIGQRIGAAAASAGTHEKDGEFTGQDGHLYPYAVCLDIRVAEISHDTAMGVLRQLWKAGFAGWYRCADFPEDHWPGVTHIHVLWPGAPMKAICRAQIHDWCSSPSKNGLASHLRYHFAQPTDTQRQAVRALFLAHNPVEG